MRKPVLSLFLALLLLGCCACKATAPENTGTPTEEVHTTPPATVTATEPVVTEPVTEPSEEPEAVQPTVPVTSGVTVPIQDGEIQIDMDFTMPDTSKFVEIEPIDMDKIDFSPGFKP